MDVKIKDGDILLNVCGDCEYIDEIDELVQRVKIACTVKKGSFIYNRELGCHNFSVDMNDELLCDKLEMIFKEATADIPYTDLKVINVEETESGVTAKLRLYFCATEITTEVMLDGNI